MASLTIYSTEPVGTEIYQESPITVMSQDEYGGCIIFKARIKTTYDDISGEVKDIKELAFSEQLFSINKEEAAHLLDFIKRVFNI